MAACGASVRARDREAPTVVLVEDNDAVRHLSEELLWRLGYNVLAAASGWDALRLLGDHEDGVALLITDIVMPEMSGLEIADRILDRWPDAGVIYTSGYADDSIMIPGVVAPEATFLRKPYSLRQLSRAAYAVAPLNT
jgi:two-component system cell cycle sensor histidine kinase/response regulator CckA